jgi:hypothetical protein
MPPKKPELPGRIARFVTPAVRAAADQAFGKTPGMI